MSQRILIAWFRRDLRVRDHAALYRATQEAEAVVPLFILDPALLSAPHAGAARVSFLLESLRILDQSLRALGSSLIVRRGDPLEVLCQVAAETGADGVYFNQDYVWPGRERDDRVSAALRERGISVCSLADQVLVEPADLLTGQGKPYTVFTPYRNAWLRQPAAPPLPAPSALRTPPIASLEIPDAGSLGYVCAHPLPAAGEHEGHRLLATFAEGADAPIARYRSQRNMPALAGTSRLSPHLRFGTVGVRTALAAALHAAGGASGEHGEGARTWISELAWRDFYHQWIWHHPHVLQHPFDPAFEALPFENDPGLYAAWCAGRTGFPIVDAAMRQLNGIGWMHNRLRMIAASFLCKDLLCDWRLGESYFWQQLVDGDKPANVGGWQWSASVGVDPQPYFRIFNPTTQGERFDPEGAFVRSWVPELARLPARYIHRPATLPPLEAEALGFRLGRDYPHPIVDHAVQRERALALYGRAKRPA